MKKPPPTIRRDIRIFISAVTCELNSARKRVKKGLEVNRYHTDERDDFPPDYRVVKEKLRNLIASCDAVVHIAGRCYGLEPKERPADAPRRSYTQLEYDIAVELSKPVYVFLIGADFPADPHEPEPDELLALQEEHRRRLTSTDRDFSYVNGLEQLDQEIRSIQLKVERLTEELQHAAVTGSRLGRRLAMVAFLVVAALGAVGFVGWQQQVEHRAAEQERAKQEAARKEAETVKKVQQEFAERFLQQLLLDKQVSAEDAR
jgi:hypothetical protein